MKDKNISIIFSSGIDSITEHNSTFDSGVLRIAYTGRNRNNTFISKTAFEAALASLRYCPLVCRYDPEQDIIGSHDTELIKREDGVFLINATHPVGFVPDEAEPFWETVEEDDGSIHEYLCTQVLLWKRQPAYQKIKSDGVVKHSMELHIQDGHMGSDKVYYIERFEFTALCLLGTAEPCFESSALEVFAFSDFKAQYVEMMQEFKATLKTVDPSCEVDIHPHNFSEGGKQELQEKTDLLNEYGVTAEQLSFDIESISIDELKCALEELKAAEVTVDETVVDESDNKEFALTEQFKSELIEALTQEKVDTPWGESPRYWYLDYDAELNEVYCEDSQDYKIYGFMYSVNGDVVTVDFECKKRKKFAFVDFDEGDQTQMFAEIFNKMTEEFNALSAKYNQSASDVEHLKGEVDVLNEYKLNIEKAKARHARDEVFEQFEDLIGIEAFEALRDNPGELSIEELEDKCYALRGRYKVQMSFAYNPQKSAKIKISNSENQPEPYGGVVSRYKGKAD